ncbi:MAG TPA: amidohydrolase family protein [Pirellulaceae bacterium]|jgi:imidazolonepropionase-like amidohydrolase|nr:amidohydrolase family protein [Pirellulaceae bacterium]
MARLLLVSAALSFSVALSSPMGSAAEMRAFVGARIIPIEGKVIPHGVILISGKKILAVGTVGKIDIPKDAQQVDVDGRVIMPGLICTHSHIGGVGAADGSGPIQPGVRVSDSINIHDSGFRRAIAGGLTTLNIMPGSGHLSSGQTAYVKLRFSADGPRTIDDLFLRDSEGEPLGGLKMANGTNSMKGGNFPETRGKSAFLVRQQFILAREYHAKVTAAKGESADLPPRDLHLETLVEVMQGKRIVHHHTHRHDDIMTVLRLSSEFGFRVVLHHVSEGWKVAPEIAAAKAPCSIILVDSPGGKLEARYLRFETPKILEQAGVRCAFHTDDLITDSRYFFRMAALAVRAGMSRQAALEGLTLAGAEMLDLQDRVGSLRAGKDADFIILDGNPLSVYTKVLETWVEGRRVFDRSDPKDYLFAVGGFGAGHDQRPYFCCFDQTRQGESR